MVYCSDDKLKTGKWILIGIVIAVVMSFAPLEITSPIFIATLGLSFGLFLVFLFQDDSKDRVILLNIFILAFLSRIIASVFLYNFVFLRNGTGLLGDAWPHSDNGYHILGLWQQGIKDFETIAIMLEPINNAGNLGFYDVWNAMIYSFTGLSPLSVVFINCLAASLTILVVYHITAQIYDRKAARLAAILIAFWPSAFLWSIQNLKEAVSAFLICVLVWICVRLWKKFSFYLIFLGILTAFALQEFRGVGFAVFVVALFVSFLLPYYRYRKIEGLVLVAFLFLLFFLYRDWVNIKPWLSNVINTEIDTSFLDFIYEKRGFRATGGSAFLTNFDFRNPLKLVLYLPVGIFVAWLAPFPWQMGSMLQIASIPETLCYYVFLFYMAAGIKYIMRHKVREAGIIITMIFIMLVCLALIEGNIGTLFRHRSMVFPLMSVLGGIGFFERKKGKKVNGAR